LRNQRRIKHALDSRKSGQAAIVISLGDRLSDCNEEMVLTAHRLLQDILLMRKSLKTKMKEKKKEKRKREITYAAVQETVATKSKR